MVKWLIGFCIFCVSFSFAQSDKRGDKKEGSSKNTSIPKNVKSDKDLSKYRKVTDIDSIWIHNLYKSKLVDSVFTSLDVKFDSAQIAKLNEISSDTLKVRLKSLRDRTPFAIPHNDDLENLIKGYLKTRRKYYPVMMGRAAYFLPIYEEQLAIHKLPEELKYLSVIESALRPRAVSKVGATGLWQFMYQTGKQYGLKVSSYVDERQDPLKATKAACRFLAQLYNTFNDWELALAAYNCGPGNVLKAIKRSGNKTNFWELRPYLPKETANYVPAFYATMYIFEYAKEHKIQIATPLIRSFEADTIVPKRTINFKQVNEFVGTSIEMLEFLNPSYKHNIIPKVGSENKLVLPLKDALRFASVEKELYAQIDEAEKPKVVEVPVKEDYQVNERQRHLVKKGEYLSSIARQYQVTVKDIMKWNNLLNQNVKPGDYLTILPKKEVDLLALVAEQEQKAKKLIPETATKTTTHTVVSGDNLWKIAQKHKVTIDELMKWNNFSKTPNLKVGDQIKIQKK